MAFSTRSRLPFRYVDAILHIFKNIQIEIVLGEAIAIQGGVVGRSEDGHHVAITCHILLKVGDQQGSGWILLPVDFPCIP